MDFGQQGIPQPPPATGSTEAATEAAKDDGAVLTLEKAIARGLEGNRAYQRARQESDRARGRQNEARSQRNLTASGSAAYTRLDNGQTISVGPTSVVGTYPDQTNFTAEIRLPVDVAGLLRTNVQATELQRLLVEMDAQSLHNQLLLDIRTAYYRALRARSLHMVAEAAMENARTRLQDARIAHREGIVPQFDVLRAQTGLASAQQRRIQAANEVQLARAALHELIGLPLEYNSALQEPDAVTRLAEAQLAEARTEPDDKRTVASETVPPEGAVSAEYETAIARALTQRPEILAANINLRASELGITLARRSLAPSFGLQASAQYNPNAGAFQQRDLLTVGAQLTIPFSDGGLARARRQQAEADHAIAQTLRQQVEEQIRLEVQQAMLYRREAFDRLQVAIQARQEAREASRMATVRYRSGVTRAGISPLLEVSDAQTAETQAESDITNALYDVLVAEARLDKALG
ncbi:MAG: efflux transporter outer membrane subunit [Armatimonadaceae bacterium]